MTSPRDVANRIPITGCLMLATLMNTLDSTIANVALPHIQGSVSAAQDQITWVLTSYIIATAIMTPLSGWLSQRFGRKRMFLLSIFGFTVASMLCGIATNLPEIVLFRLLQGIAGASMMPLSQTLLQRQLYVRALFRFKLSWEFGLLEPMDIVTLTDANLGLNAYPVRIRSIEEAEKGLLHVEAEELALGLSTAAAYAVATAQSAVSNPAASASAINPPLIYEPPPALTGGVAQLWLDASGVAGNANWGGANVWVSLDGATFSQIAAITRPLRQGTLTAALPSATGWDSADTLAVNLAVSGGALSGTSAAGASQGVTLSLVEAELLAYQTATLTADANYALTGLQRGLDGSLAAAHANGAAFARLDSAIVKYQLPSNYIGQNLQFKFQSFNIFGAGLESLSSCAAYAYRPTGASGLGPVAASLAAGASLDYGLASASMSESDDFGNFTAPYVTSIDLGMLTS